MAYIELLKKDAFDYYCIFKILLCGDVEQKFEPFNVSIFSINKEPKTLQ